MDKKFYKDLPELVFEYLLSIEKEKFYTFYPASSGLTENGKKINLGFSCFGLKIYFMTGNWHKLHQSEKIEWINFINSFQKEETKFPKNSFIDYDFINSYNNLGIFSELKYIFKSTLNILPNQNFETKQTALTKAINAETKQAISTLYEVGAKNTKTLENSFNSKNLLESYLNSLDWSKPWSSGAQFSSLCVYSVTQNHNTKEYLNNFIEKILNFETGSYFKNEPKTTREIINGAMKVITGLDWLNVKIHKPEKLIDFCLNNKPILEGCDIVDFTYVLYKCSKQTDYRKSEINTLFLEFLNDINKLFIKEEGGFSYFLNSSQTYYYGAKITSGDNYADIHGTTLCLWAVMMILDSLEEKNPNNFIIKP